MQPRHLLMMIIIIIDCNNKFKLCWDNKFKFLIVGVIGMDLLYLDMIDYCHFSFILLNSLSRSFSTYFSVKEAKIEHG